MTASQPQSFGRTVGTAPGAAVVRVAGDPGHETHGALLAAVTSPLTPGATAPTEVRPDSARLRGTDSGLSALLRIRRRTGRAGLRPDRRPAPLDRFLELTGTLEYLAAPGEAGGRGQERRGPGRIRGALRMAPPQGGIWLLWKRACPDRRPTGPGPGGAPEGKEQRAH
ncbi:anti-sigma factor antagonist [Streptomyces sp. NPDC051041]|uniref:anti-sigma factor antagonist n=1 Tax=Streptomyces sp. NPDC051041 TaxID=3365640 RepID=UPI0037AF8EFF